MTTETVIYKSPLPSTETQSLSDEDKDFWSKILGVNHEEIPDIVVGCTGSLRKVLMFLYTVKRFGLVPLGSKQKAESWQEAVLDLPPYIEQQLAQRESIEEYRSRVTALFQLPEQEQPLALQQLFKDLIPNGDGTILVGSRIEIGILHGVRIFIQSGNGETPDNNHPSLEAEAKAIAVGADEDFQNRKVLYIGMDTIGQPQAGERASKPASEAEYKRYKLKPDHEQRPNWEEYYAIWYLLYRYLGLIQDQFEEWLQGHNSVETARQSALEVIAQHDDQSFSETHIVGIAVVLGDKSLLTDIQSVVEIRKLFADLANMGFDAQAGMAGYFQQLVFRHLDQIDFRSQVNRLLYHSRDADGNQLTDLDKQFLLLFHIMGMPIASLLIYLRKLG